MLPDPAFDAMQAAIKAAYARADIPQRVHFDLTYRCDLNCRHCYLDDKQWPEMTTAEVKRLLAQLRDMGVLDLGWSGGEIFVRPDFLHLLQEAKRLGFTSHVRTHGGGLTPERAAAIADLNVRKLTVTIYSLLPAVHDAFTRTPGSLERTLAGVDLLRAAGVAVKVAVVVQPDTIDELPAIQAQMLARGCEVGFSTYMFAQLGGGHDSTALQLSGEQRAKAETMLQRLAAKTEALPAPISETGAEHACHAGRGIAYIAPDGSVWPCVMFPMALGNVREQPFAEIWRSSPERKALISWTNAERTECQSCAGSGLCFYCPGDAFTNQGDYRNRLEAFCEVTRARMAAFEEVGGKALAAEIWQSVPTTSGPPAPATPIFPIHRPEKGRGRRVQPPSRTPK